MAIASATNNIFRTSEELALINNYAIFGEFPNLSSNVLKNYTSYTYRFSLGAVTVDKWNDKSFVGDDAEIDYIVLSSSGFSGQAGSADGNRTQTIYGSPEYYINNIEIEQLMPGSEGQLTGLQGVKFEVFEPYSMGLFFQSLLSTAIRAGYQNYNDDVPFILKLEFIGWDDNGRSRTVPQATRYFPMRFQRIDFSANESGSNYVVRMIDFGATPSQTNTRGVLLNPIKFTGSTPEEAFSGTRGLATALTSQRESLANAGLIGLPDIYEINYVTEGSGIEEFFPGWVDNAYPSTASSTIATPSEVDAPTDQPTAPDIAFPEWTFHPGDADNPTAIIQVITEAMLGSNYCRAVTDGSQYNPDGTVNWFRVSTDYRLSDRIDPATNRRQATLVYNIRPHRFAASRFRHPLSTIYSSNSIRRQIKKVYNYLYTGLNDDVLEFDLTFNNTFFVAGNVAPPQNQGNRAGTGATSEPVPSVTSNTAGLDVTQGSELTNSYGFLPSLESRDGIVSTTIDDTAIQVARTIQAAISGRLTGGQTDLIAVDLKITGDPYYMPLGGLSSPDLPLTLDSFETQGGAIAWEGNDVRVYLRFKTLVDAPARGSLYRQSSETESPYSGIYLVRKVKSVFADGVFTQVLMLTRDTGTQASLDAQLGSDLGSGRNPFGLEETGVTRPNDVPNPNSGEQPDVSSTVPAESSTPPGATQDLSNG